MSWFKRGGSERRSPESEGEQQPDTDPNTCFEVFQNHWKQALAVISCQDKRATTITGLANPDGVEAVLRNLEQMVTLLVSEDDDGGLPGPILQHVLESDLLEKVCAWFTINLSAHDKLRMHQLRLFELIISQSKQMLLIHKPVIKPLLRLLIDVAESHEVSSGELEFKLVLVLHQICLCISQQNLILESFFSADADHGPARFLIFSLLIPYIHREGPVGQKARDALLLIMTLSARHPHIGQYIASNSDFCPVLATGLSGLYSSLPRKIIPPTDDWHAISWEDCVRIPDLQMFLNSLQFSNAVVQVAHPHVRKQLIEFIYSGFLVPVLAPALHQISREEVMTATAYLDLFVRHVTEPHLLKAVLQFVLLEKYEDIPILDSLLSRIGSSSHLSMVTLALFQTLINLNCEDVMFQLVFRYLVPCTHVMVSQRRSVRDLDLYSKSAEKFLSLRPKCCCPPITPGPAPAPVPPAHIVGMGSMAQRASISSISTITGPTLLPLTPTTFDTSSEQPQWETSYFEYLHDARNKLEQTLQACYRWTFPYDGEKPAPDSIASADKITVVAEVNKMTVYGHDPSGKSQKSTTPTMGYIELGSMLSMTASSDGKDKTNTKSSSDQLVANDVKSSDRHIENQQLASKIHVRGHRDNLDPNLYGSLESVDTFMNYLTDLDLKVESELPYRRLSIDDWMADLSDLLKVKSAREIHRGESSKDDRNDTFDKSSGRDDTSEKSSNKNDTSDNSSGRNYTSEKTANRNDTLDKSSDRNDISEKSSSRNDTFESSSNPAPISATIINAAEVFSPNPSSPESSIPRDAPIVPGKLDNIDTTQCNKELDLQKLDKTKPFPEVSTSITSTTNNERSVPKDLPTSLRAGIHQVYTQPSSLFSPSKSAWDLLSPFKSVFSPVDEFSMTATSSPGLTKLKYLNDPPNIGPFLSAVFTRLENMLSNSLYFNLLLTGILSRLAAYPQPLLRSFLLNHNLVFQPSVKSLIQVLSSLRQKLDNFSSTVKQFDGLVYSARQNLILREGQLFPNPELGMMGPLANTPPQLQQKPRADSILLSHLAIKEKKKVTLSDLIFRRSPGREKIPTGKSNKKQTQAGNVQIGDNNGSTTVNSLNSNSIQQDSSLHTLTTWNAVYSALVLDEFLKELAALSQEHSVLHCDEGYLSS